MCRGRRTDGKKLDEVQAARGTSSDTLLAGLGELDERVVLGENLDPVCHFHDVRTDHAIDTRALDARHTDEGSDKPQVWATHCFRWTGMRAPPSAARRRTKSYAFFARVGRYFLKEAAWNSWCVIFLQTRQSSL